MVEAESASPECVRRVCGFIFAQDVEGEALSVRHDAGVIPDPALILVAGDSAKIVISVVRRLEEFRLQPLSERCESLST